MSRFTTSWATVAAVLAGGLVAFPTPAYAGKVARQSGTLHVYDGGSMFTGPGVDRAKGTMSNVQFEGGLTLTVDTHSGVPKDRTVPEARGEREKFFRDWARELAQG
ncbi:MAG: hypothetical protein ACKODX_13575, partial [Gemmata sp.]